MTLSTEQKYVRKKMLLGGLVSVAVLLLAWWIAPLYEIHKVQNLSLRLSAFLWSLVFSVLPIILLIAKIAKERFFSSSINGDDFDSVVEIDRRVLNNTHEQFLLYLVGSLLLASSLPESRLLMIPILAFAFIAYRYAFWVGYHRNALMRAFGFAATFYTNLLMLITAVFLMSTSS